jgi:rhamnogalacturonyl hydrolase YesR
MKLLPLILVAVCLPLHAELPQTLKDFPAGCEPGVIGQRLVQRYISRGIPFADKKTKVDYPETCTWFGALRFAGATGDTTLLHPLEDHFGELLDARADLMQTPNHVDNTVFGVVPLQLYLQTGDATCRSIGIDFADRQWTMPNNPSAADRAKYQALLDRGLSWQTRFWIDDMYMITAIQSRAYLASREEKYIRRAALEMVAYLDSIQQPNGLFHHERTAPFFWGRGNGWMAAGMADLLTHLPESNPNRARILQEYRKMMATLKSYRNAEGLWNQLIDEPEAWTETSGSAMFTYAMINGIRNGWLDVDEYAPVVRKAWLALLTWLNPDGALRNVCTGTNIGFTKQYYLDRARNTGDLHGQAALLWCAVALYDTAGNADARLTSLAFEGGMLSPAFHPVITRYTCWFPAGTTAVTPRLTAVYGAKVTGAETVALTSGTGVSTITVTSSDGSATTTCTVDLIAGNGEDYTHRIVNNDFELAFDAACNPVPVTPNMNAWSNNAWRPKDSPCKRFYGWTCDLSLTGSSTSLGINADGNGKHGDWVCWIGGNEASYTEFELSQTIDKSLLPAGTYRVQCLLAAGSGDKKNNQRLFANNNACYYGNPSDYPNNRVEGEKYTFAGHTSFGESDMKEMALFITLNGNESLKTGIRTSNRLGNGTVAGQKSPMFKTDYFRLTKLDPARATDARAAAIVLSAGSLNFSPETTVYNVELPAGTTAVTATAVANMQDAAVTGNGVVDVRSGTGVSTMTVTALDGVTTRTYTVNYTVASGAGIDEVRTAAAQAACTVVNRTLTVTGADAFTVYSVNGTKVADVSESSIDLLPGAYLVKIKDNRALKAVVR